MNTISEFYDAPVKISGLAHARWRSIMRAVDRDLEVYAFLLADPKDPFTIVDMCLPRQSVSGGRCSVDRRDVVEVGAQVARKGLAVAGSIHRHPFGGSWLSGTDEHLLQEMAKELASELRSPVRMTRKCRNLVVRVGHRNGKAKEEATDLAQGIYSAGDAEIEETITGSRVYCLVWSPTDGYFGAAACVLYGNSGNRPAREFRRLSGIVVDKPSGIRIDHNETRKLARELVRCPSYVLPDYPAGVEIRRWSRH